MLNLPTSLPHECPIRQHQARCCRRWGGQLVRLSLPAIAAIPWGDHTWMEAPFTSKRELGLHWSTKTIVYCGDVPWANILHEMGHLFACTISPHELCEEYDFLGWEFAFAINVGDVETWIHTNADYCLENRWGDFGATPRSELYAVLNERLTVAYHQGLIEGPRTALRLNQLKRPH